jgi:hypothetical protein
LAASARYGDAVANLAGPGSVTFLSAGLTAFLIAGGMAVGCLGGVIAAQGARAAALEG